MRRLLPAGRVTSRASHLLAFAAIGCNGGAEETIGHVPSFPRQMAAAAVVGRIAGAAEQLERARVLVAAYNLATRRSTDPACSGFRQDTTNVALRADGSFGVVVSGEPRTFRGCFRLHVSGPGIRDTIVDSEPLEFRFRSSGSIDTVDVGVIPIRAP